MNLNVSPLSQKWPGCNVGNILYVGLMLPLNGYPMLVSLYNHCVVPFLKTVTHIYV